MAKMIPRFISKNVQSHGEKIIFHMLENEEKTDDWVVLHSLNIPKHIKRYYGEIDFLILVPGLGIFCLEVKSGQLKRNDDGIYTSSDRFGRSFKYSESPIVQVKNNMYSLMDGVKRKFGWSSRENNLLFCYGVVFTHISYKDDDIEIEKPLIYDNYDIKIRKKPIQEYLAQVSEYTSKKLYDTYKKKKIVPDKKDIENLSKFLRGKFEFNISEKERFENTEVEIEKFTEEQYRCLDGLEGNPRLLINGPVGTGKTILAIESARRCLYNNERVLILCFNKLLGYKINQQLSKFSADYDFYAGSFNEYLETLVIDHGELKKSNDIDEYYYNVLPEEAIKVAGDGKFRKFDKIIIDGAQDIFFREKYMKVIDSLVYNGIKNGKLELYSDFTKYNFFGEIIDKEKVIEILGGRDNLTTYNLTVNCRNSRSISGEISKLFNFKKPETMSDNLDDSPVEYKYYKGKQDGVKLLEDILINFYKQAIPLQNITILSAYQSPHKLQNSLIYSIDKNKFNITDLSKNDTLFFEKHDITFCSIYKFKGMENSYIIIIDIDSNIDNDRFEDLLYNGMSRAKVNLKLLVSDNIKDKIVSLRENK